MKKKATCVVFCVAFLLIFTSLSFGDGEPTPKDKADPWDRIKSPPFEEGASPKIVMMVVNLGFCQIYRFECKDISWEKPSKAETGLTTKDR